MEKPNVIKIIQTLYEKSKKREINWLHSSEVDPEVIPTADDYAVILSNSYINIFQYQDDDPYLSISNKNGKRIFISSFEDNGFYQGRLRELIVLAKNKVDNVEETVESILSELDSSGVVGEEIKEPEDSDIPF